MNVGRVYAHHVRPRECGSSLLEHVSLPFLLSDCSDGIFLKVKVQLFLIVTD